ncbi:hypothetical protein B0H14DRAFT_3163375 [Mycena olivaceomarginata]|nr:hypothetical protein B0H14DRAFT_3163375 [Mycena olivaceomarginata]
MQAQEVAQAQAKVEEDGGLVKVVVQVQLARECTPDGADGAATGGRRSRLRESGGGVKAPMRTVQRDSSNSGGEEPPRGEIDSATVLVTTRTPLSSIHNEELVIIERRPERSAKRMKMGRKRWMLDSERIDPGCASGNSRRQIATASCTRNRIAASYLHVPRFLAVERTRCRTGSRIHELDVAQLEVDPWLVRCKGANLLCRAGGSKGQAQRQGSYPMDKATLRGSARAVIASSDRGPRAHRPFQDSNSTFCSRKTKVAQNVRGNKYSELGASIRVTPMVASSSTSSLRVGVVGVQNHGGLADFGEGETWG